MVMLPRLAFDELVNILYWLPPERHYKDSGSVKALTSFLCASHLFRDAASVPSLWKAHYQIRYEHCDAFREQCRMDDASGNWLALYAGRRLIDNTAASYLSKLLEDRTDRYHLALTIVDLSMDIWDFLELECSCPIPASFMRPEDQPDQYGGPIMAHAITRRYWARTLLETLSRLHAVSEWRKFWTSDDHPSFEDTMSLMSCFFGKSDRRIKRQLDLLADNCSKVLVSKDVVLAQDNPMFNARRICREIVNFMRAEGFCPPSSRQADIWTNFPHAYLTTHKQAIPISLTHVFVAIASRIGLKVSPVNFPGTVLAYVHPESAGRQPIVVNTHGTTPPEIASELYEADPVPGITFLDANSIAELLQPCSEEFMLMRASRNLLASIVAMRSSTTTHACILKIISTHLLFGADDITLGRFMESIRLQPWDCIFLQKGLEPSLIPRCQAFLERHTETVLSSEAYSASTPFVRQGSSVKVMYFVGMPFIHAKYAYLGFIYSWDSTCRAAEEWIKQMKVDSLERGRNQPFYSVIDMDGTERYVAEENIEPAAFTKMHIISLHQKNQDFPLYFEGVQFPKEPGMGPSESTGRGRLLMNPHTKHIYPDDDHIGLHWVETGSFLKDW